MYTKETNLLTEVTATDDYLTNPDPLNDNLLGFNGLRSELPFPLRNNAGSYGITSDARGRTAHIKNLIDTQ